MTELKEGDYAPEIEATDQDGNMVRLSDYKGHKVILFFYPRDNTPTCTIEACNFRDNYDLLSSKGFAILGISTDTERKHRNFIRKFNLPFPLIADPEMKVVNRYQVYGPKKFMGRDIIGTYRTTFVLDENSVIIKILRKVTSKDAAGQILRELQIET